MPAEFVSAVVLLALVTDPFGNVPLVNAMLAGVPAARRRLVILRECSIAFTLLITFMLFGHKFLEVMRLSETSLSIAGGVILFMIAIRMVFPGTGGALAGEPKGEPFIVPLAIPFIAGPSAIATVMLLVSRDPQHSWRLVLALTLTMLATALVLVAGEAIQNRIGRRAVEAIQRLMGLILTAIAVQMLLDGIRQFVTSLTR